MIRVLLVDDHPAVRAGLRAVIRCEPGLVPVADAATAAGALELVDSERLDVALVDYHLPDQDGLSLCWHLKRLPTPPRVLIYSAFAEARLGLLARVAGADGVLDKSAPTEELFDAIRRLARGERCVPQPTPELMTDIAGALEAEDVPIFGLLVNRVSSSEAAQALRLDCRDLDRKVLQILGRLRV